MNFSVLKRILGYIFRYYKWHFLAVILCIIGATICTLQGTLFMQSLIDDYISPMLQKTLDTAAGFAQLKSALIRLSLILAVGVICSFAYNRIMIYVSQ